MCTRKRWVQAEDTKKNMKIFKSPSRAFVPLCEKLTSYRILSYISCQKTCWFQILRVRGLACGPQGHTGVLESDDGNSTNMTGKLTSFANHACCRKFRCGN